MGSLPALFMATGILASYILGSWLTWQQLALISAVFPGTLFFLLLPLPESPVWLRNRGEVKASEKAMSWLHLPPPQQSSLNPRTERAPLNSYFRSSVMVPFFLVTLILFFQQVSGIDTIIFYTVDIFRSSGSAINDYSATVIVGLVQLVATFLSLFLVDRFGRRVLLLVSGLLMGLSMGALGAYFYLYQQQRADSLGLLPLFSQLLFIAGFSVGFSNVPFLLMGELLPEAQRSFLSSVSSAVTLGTAFLSIKTYPALQSLLGLQGVFWLYSGFCFFSCIFVFIFLPETKGKSLEEIEHYFQEKEQQVVSKEQANTIVEAR
jgi:facilitated trehalose transporter